VVKPLATAKTFRSGIPGVTDVQEARARQLASAQLIAASLRVSMSCALIIVASLRITKH
jgi:hypothetical protein